MHASYISNPVQFRSQGGEGNVHNIACRSDEAGGSPASFMYVLLASHSIQFLNMVAAVPAYSDVLHTMSSLGVEDSTLPQFTEHGESCATSTADDKRSSTPKTRVRDVGAIVGCGSGSR